MRFLKKYWHLVMVSLVTLGLGVATILTSQKLTETKPVAPTVPQVKPKATAPACTLAFAIATTTPSVTPTVTTTPVPTATPTPTPQPTATPTPTPSPTQRSNDTPECTGLTVSPSSGNAPLAITLTCSGIDRDGDITAASFSFGDGQTKTVEKNVGSPGSLSTSYTYAKSGSFGASCRVRDNNFVFTGTPDMCKKTVTINGGSTGTTTTTTSTTVTTPAPVAQATPTEPPTPKVPVAGAGPSILGATTIVGGLILLLLGLAL